ncbi:MAG: nuclear transport factor 2 family protein [Candidatus Zixiibacteriota bacterium]
MLSKNVNTLLEFIEKINTSDADALSEMMTDNHKYIDLAGDEVIGREKMLYAWEAYMKAFPDYTIYIKDIYENDDKIIFRGTTIGSHLGLEDDEEFMEEQALWLVKINKDKLSLWQIIKDTKENQEKLDIDNSTRVSEGTIYKEYHEKYKQLKAD